MAATCIPRHVLPFYCPDCRTSRWFGSCANRLFWRSKEQDGEVDPYWDEFLNNVDGRGTSLPSFARRLLISSLLYGHGGCLVDYPSREAAPSLQAERLAGMRPYFCQVDAKQIIGWRFEEGNPLAQVDQVRINEYVSVPFGEFGDKTIRQVRVLEPWQVSRLPP